MVSYFFFLGSGTTPDPLQAAQRLAATAPDPRQTGHRRVLDGDDIGKELKG